MGNVKKRSKNYKVKEENITKLKKYLLLKEKTKDER